jgi:transketolase
MLEPSAKLNSNMFKPDAEKRATRDGYGEGLLTLGGSNTRVVVLTADLTESTRVEAFVKKYPERFFECGVAEQNMATIAAGLGISGKIPFISSYATFSPGRNLEQIRTTIAYNDANVKIAGHHAGVSVGPDGATHQATEDIAWMRTMPNMRVMVPCDAVEAKKATVAAAKIKGPVYLRFGREKSPVVTTGKTPFTPGKAELFWDSKKPEVGIVACGLLVHTALRAAQELKADGIEVAVLNMHTIKPLDGSALRALANRAGALVIAEEHQIAGGLGGAIAEFFAKEGPVPMEFIGMHDAFGQSGPPEALLEFYGMGVGAIKDAVKRVRKRK